MGILEWVGILLLLDVAVCWFFFDRIQPWLAKKLQSQFFSGTSLKNILLGEAVVGILLVLTF